MNDSVRRELKRLLKMLQRSRLAADYEPLATIDRVVALISVLSASRVAHVLEVAQ